MSTTDKIEVARCALRTAHSDRSQAIENLEAAREAADRSKTLLDGAEAELRDHQAAATAADDAAAGRLAARIRDGEAPAAVVDLRDDAPAIALIGAQRRYSTARAAHDALVADIAAADAALREAEAAVERAAVAVIANEATEMAAEMRSAMTTARELELRFHGIERLLTATMPEVSAPLVPVVREARRILEVPNPLLTSIPGHDPRTITTRRMVAYLSALRSDPDATFDAIADPQERRPAAAAE